MAIRFGSCLQGSFQGLCHASCKKTRGITDGRACRPRPTARRSDAVDLNGAYRGEELTATKLLLSCNRMVLSKPAHLFAPPTHRTCTAWSSVDTIVSSTQARYTRIRMMWYDSGSELWRCCRIIRFANPSALSFICRWSNLVYHRLLQSSAVHSMLSYDRFAVSSNETTRRDARANRSWSSSHLESSLEIASWLFWGTECDVVVTAILHTWNCGWCGIRMLGFPVRRRYWREERLTCSTGVTMRSSLEVESSLSQDMVSPSTRENWINWTSWRFFDITYESSGTVVVKK